MVQGNAAPQAEITLHAATPLKDEMGRDIFPHARVNDDGTFELTTYVPGDGAPAGEYRITVVWRKITIEAGEETFSHDLLFDRYANPLNGQVIKIEAKENQLDPIQLQ